MIEHQPSESDRNSADPFEQLLRGCKPAGGKQVEQMLYQAGWHAAMAQVERIASFEKYVAVDPLLNQKAGVAVASRKATSSWNWFGSGLATGVAVGLLGVWLVLSVLDMNRPSTIVRADNQIEPRGSGDLTDRSSDAVAHSESNQAQTDRDRLSSLRREVSGLGWSNWFGFPPEKNLGLVTDRTELEFAGIDWEALSPSYRKQRKLWQDSQRRKANEEPRTFETLIYRPLTEAKIKDLL